MIKTKLVRAKIAQGDNMVHVSSTMHRTFGPGDWQQLHQLLTQVHNTRSFRPFFQIFVTFQWKSNIHTVKEQMQHVASAQVNIFTVVSFFYISLESANFEPSLNSLVFFPRLT